MENIAPRKLPTPVRERGSWLLLLGGLVFFYLAWALQGHASGYWLPGIGIGIALTAWLGWSWFWAIALTLLVERWWSHGGQAPLYIALEAVLHIALIGSTWWLYHDVARGSRRLDDPRSVTIFLILGPGVLAALFAVIQSLVLALDLRQFWFLAAEFWLSRMVGILVAAPLLIIVGTPLLVRYRLVTFDLPPTFFGERYRGPSRLGEGVELAGLTFATSGLALMVLWAHVNGNVVSWMLWASCLVLIVWTCVRQGMTGGCFCASITSIVVLVAAQTRDWSAYQSGVQGHLLAFTSSALLVGVSATWIRATELRFRHVISRIPFVVYSARLPYGIPTLGSKKDDARADRKFDVNVGPSIGKIAEVMLVSPASRDVFDCEPEALIGPFAAWLERIEPADRELVIASLAQLCLQDQPVTCEYRLRPAAPLEPAANTRMAAPVQYRWLRDTLTPHHSDDGLVDGWEGLIEDITDQRTLSNNLRKMTNMLQVLLTNLPTGVYFVQAPQGYPILVNARARQLLGQREDLSAGLANLSRIFRLHKPDGTEYPADELPVAKALRLGVACKATDIVVHRPDGRKTQLVTWAAPIDLANTGTPDAAVWVLEDWTTMQQAEGMKQAKHLELVGQLASGTVHDFNNLLTILMGMAGLAKNSLPADHAALKYLTRIEDIGQQASQLTGQLLTFSKKQPSEIRPIDLNVLIQQTLKLAKSVLPRNVDVKTEFDTAAPLVLAAELPLKQVVINLCLNAKDAMPEGGTLTIRTDHAPAPSNGDGQSTVHLAIHDTGHGMPDDVRERIFDPFFTTKERGTGLGLAVVQQIIKEFGGRIEVWSEPGQGTRFDIWLSRAPVAV